MWPVIRSVGTTVQGSCRFDIRVRKFDHRVATLLALAGSGYTWIVEADERR